MKITSLGEKIDTDRSSSSNVLLFNTNGTWYSNIYDFPVKILITEMPQTSVSFKAGLGLAGPAETRMFLERWNQIDMILLVSWSADSPVSHDK